MSEHGKTIRRGTTLHWNLFRQASQSTTEEVYSLDFIFVLYLIALVVLVPVSFLIGKPVSMWVHLHSLQLMTYLTLLKDPLTPANVSLFLDKYLSLVRFNSPDMTVLIDDAYDASRRSESEDFNLYSENNTLLKQLGYGPFFFDNMPILLALFGFSCLIWAFATLKNNQKVPHVWRRKYPTLLRRSGQDEIFMGNLTLRFYHTFFLEMTICCFLSLKSNELSSSGAIVQWILSLLFLLATLTLIGYLGLLLWRGGPYIPGYYQKLTLWSLMCWGTRPINPKFDQKTWL